MGVGEEVCRRWYYAAILIWEEGLSGHVGEQSSATWLGYGDIKLCCRLTSGLDLLW